MFGISKAIGYSRIWFRLESLDMLPKIDSDKEAQIEEEVRVEVREAFDKQKIDVENDSISDEIQKSSTDIIEENDSENINEDTSNIDDVNSNTSDAIDSKASGDN